MKNDTSQFLKQSHRIQTLSRILIPICWSLIILILVITVVAANYLLKPDSQPSFNIPALIMNFGIPILFWIGLLSLMLRFFTSCYREGIFSKIAISNIRWIGRLILVSAVIKLLNLVYLMLEMGYQSPIVYYFTTSLPSAISNLILGIFLLILCKIMATGNGLEQDSALTI